MTDFEDQARAALAAKGDTQRQLAAAAVYPQWRHAIFGVMMGGLVLVPALPSGARIAMFAALLIAMPLIMRADRERSGMFINGYRRGKTLYVTFAMLALEMMLFAVSFHRAIVFDDRHTAFLLAPLAVAVGWIGSLIWQRVMIAELER